MKILLIIKLYTSFLYNASEKIKNDKKYVNFLISIDNYAEFMYNDCIMRLYNYLMVKININVKFTFKNIGREQL